MGCVVAHLDLADRLDAHCFVAGGFAVACFGDVNCVVDVNGRVGGAVAPLQITAEVNNRGRVIFVGVGTQNMHTGDVRVLQPAVGLGKTIGKRADPLGIFARQQLALAIEVALDIDRTKNPRMRYGLRVFFGGVWVGRLVGALTIGRLRGIVTCLLRRSLCLFSGSLLAGALGVGLWLLRGLRRSIPRRNCAKGAGGDGKDGLERG